MRSSVKSRKPRMIRELTSICAVAAVVAVSSIHDATAQGEVLCPVCPDRYRSIAPDNLPVPTDAMRYMWVATESGLKAVRNPNWKGAGLSSQSSNPPETSERERNSGRVCQQYEQSVACVLTAEPDRSDSVYHRLGYDIFRADMLESIGGVVSQYDELLTPSGSPVTVAIELRQDGSYPGHICVSDGVAEGKYAIDYADLVAMTLFVSGGGTSLYTLWERDRLPENFKRSAGFVEHTEEGHVALEFGKTRYADALHFVDTCMACVGPSNNRLVSQANGEIGGGTSAGPGDDDSYDSFVNADLGALFSLNINNNNAEVDGKILRFYWGMADEFSKRLVVRAVRPLVLPAELPAQIAENLAEVSLRQEIVALTRGINLRQRMLDEGNEPSRRKLADGLFLFETLALLRSARKNAPEEWAVFRQALASEMLVRAEKEPWKRYTELYCRDVYVDTPVCEDVLSQIELF